MGIKCQSGKVEECILSSRNVNEYSKLETSKDIFDVSGTSNDEKLYGKFEKVPRAKLYELEFIVGK